MCPDKALSIHKDDERSRAFPRGGCKREHNTCLCLILAGKQAATGVDNDSIFSLWIIWIFQKKITKSAKINDNTFILLLNPTPAQSFKHKDKKITSLVTHHNWPIKEWKCLQIRKMNRQIKDNYVEYLFLLARLKSNKHTDECKPLKFFY